MRVLVLPPFLSLLVGDDDGDGFLTDRVAVSCTSSARNESPRSVVMVIRAETEQVSFEFDSGFFRDEAAIASLGGLRNRM